MIQATYFQPRAPRPDPALDDRQYAAAHCTNTTPDRVFTFGTLAEFAVWCRQRAAVGRKGDAGYIIGGDCATTRKEGGPAPVALIDQDEGAHEPDWAALDKYEGFAWTTASHRPDKPSWRVVIPFTEPLAHGKLRCPFRGGHIRNRTQPAFLPTHTADVAAVEWRWLAGAKRLDARELGGEAKAFASRGGSLLGAAFDAAGLVIGEQPDALVVRCPWVHLHSDGGASGTVVFHADPDDEGFGKFYCSRTECMGKGWTSQQALAQICGLPAVAHELAHWTGPSLDGYVRHGAPVEAAAAESSAPGAAASGMPDQRMMAPPEAWLDWMNSKHTALTCIGGKFRVLSWVRNSLGWRATVLSSVDDFKLRYAPLRAYIEGCLDDEGNAKPVLVANWWLQQTGRDEALTLCFRPDSKDRIVDGQLNMWEGYGCAARPGSWAKMRQFIHDIAADGDAQADDYIFRWMAWVVQNPGARAEVVLVLKGAKGTGKNTLFDALCELFGKHGKTVANPKHLTGNFNSHLQDTALLFANEAIPPNDKGAESILKALVTDKSIAIERKGVDAEMVRNSLSVGMASNETWCVPASIDERRFAVFQVSPARRGDEAYFGAIHDELDAGGREAMLHDLLSFDLGKWHPRAHVPKTKPLVLQQLESLRGAERIVYQMLEAGEWLGVVTLPGMRPGFTFVSTRWATKAAGKDPTHEAAIGRELGRCCEPEDRAGSQHQVNGLDRVRGKWMPAMKRARELWAQSHGLTVDWSDLPD